MAKSVFPETLVLPSQVGNAGKYLTTDSSSASWANVSSDPIPQILMLGGM